MDRAFYCEEKLHISGKRHLLGAFEPLKCFECPEFDDNWLLWLAHYWSIMGYNPIGVDSTSKLLHSILNLCLWTSFGVFGHQLCVFWTLENPVPWKIYSSKLYSNVKNRTGTTCCPYTIEKWQFLGVILSLKLMYSFFVLQKHEKGIFKMLHVLEKRIPNSANALLWDTVG